MDLKKTNTPPDSPLMPIMKTPTPSESTTDTPISVAMPDINTLQPSNQPSAIPSTLAGIESRIRYLETSLAASDVTIRSLGHGLTALERENQFLQTRIQQYEHSLHGPQTGTTTTDNTVLNANNRAQAEQSFGTTPGRGEDIGPATTATPDTNHNDHSPSSPSRGLLRLLFRLSTSDVYNHATHPRTPGTPGLAPVMEWEFTVRRDDDLVAIREILAGRVGRGVGELGFEIAGGGILGEGRGAVEAGLGEGDVVLVGLSGEGG